jgi:protein SCO1/2
VDAGLQQTPAVPVLVPVGSPLPNFELTDQANRRVALSSLRGKVVAVTFIYTRCPLPDYCPRMVHNFRVVRDRFAAQMDHDLVLLTISFDPKFDTPETLARYAASQRADGPGWHFLTGDPADVERVCNAFGIQYWPEEGMITHSLQTAVIDRDGRLAATVEGKEFTPKQLGDLVAAVLAQD